MYANGLGDRRPGRGRDSRLAWARRENVGHAAGARSGRVRTGHARSIRSEHARPQHHPGARPMTAVRQRSPYLKLGEHNNGMLTALEFAFEFARWAESQHEITAESIAARWQVSRATAYRYLGSWQQIGRASCRESVCEYV